MRSRFDQKVRVGLQHPSNPLAPFNESTPHTQAMAEGHVWIDDQEELIYTFHTIRKQPRESC